MLLMSCLSYDMLVCFVCPHCVCFPFRIISIPVCVLFVFVWKVCSTAGPSRGWSWGNAHNEQRTASRLGVAAVTTEGENPELPGRFCVCGARTPVDNME